MSEPGVKPFRFGVNMTMPSARADWVEKCRKAEAVGYDVIAVADHLTMPPPFPALVLAAEATERVRLSTFVLNAGFCNPTLLAREVAGTDQFTDGRLELGLGAGYVRAEFEAAGIPWLPAGRRVDHLEHTLKELKRLLSDPAQLPQPLQEQGPPLLIAGRGDRLLTLAAEHADIIGLSGMAPGKDGEPPTLDTAEGVDERMGFVRGKLGERAPEVELNILIQAVVITEDRRSALEDFQAKVQNLSVEQLDEVPTAAIGTPRQIADQLLAHRERFGFSYFTVLESHLDDLAPVLELLR